MAISYTDVTIGGVTREAIVLSGSEDTAEVILRDFLSPYDEEVFEAINDSAGADFEAKFNAYVLENGRKASDVYADFVKVVGEHDLAARRLQAESLTISDIIQLQDDLADAQAV